jgi:predicted Rossmann fold flavoprotein
MEVYDVAIIGAGASGLMAGVAASTNGAKTVLIEKNTIVGKKLLVTGNSRCNITNKTVNASRYHGVDPGFVEPAFSRFGVKETLKFFKSLGLETKEEDQGRIFPVTDKAETVVKALQNKLEEGGVVLKTSSPVKQISKKEAWEIILENSDTIKSKKLILATGGKAAYTLGSSGDGLFWAKVLGHTIQPIYAALVPLETQETWPEKAQGVKLTAKVIACYKNKEVASSSGDLLFTHFGLSGPAAMGISGLIADKLEQPKDPVELKIDLFPTLSFEALDKIIADSFDANGSTSVSNNLSKLLPQKLTATLITALSIKNSLKSAEVSKNNRQQITTLLKNVPLTVKKIRPLKEAQVTRGGIDTDKINNNTLESNLISELFFCGEIIDIYGDSGGFNLQWAWSSGYVAGAQASGAKGMSDQKFMI